MPPKTNKFQHFKKKAVRTFTKEAAQVVSQLAGQGRTVVDKRLDGEMHGLLRLPNGKFQFANYMGPGTQIITRLQRGDSGLTPVDRLAKVHDIDYALATTPSDVRKADTEFIRGIRRARKQGESTFNVRQAQLLVPKAAYERITGRTLFNDLKGPGKYKSFLLKNRRK